MERVGMCEFRERGREKCVVRYREKMDISGKLIFGLKSFSGLLPLLAVLSGFHGNNPLLH